MSLEDPDERAVLRARDDQHTAAFIECTEEMRAMAETADIAAVALLGHGVPQHMVMSQLTGVIAARLHEALLDLREREDQE